MSSVISSVWRASGIWLLPFDPVLTLAVIGLCVCSLLTLTTATEGDIAGNPHYYVVRHGNNFYAISRRFHLTLERLRSLNPDVNEHALQTGQRIRVG